MFITKDLLQEKGACQSGTRWFLEKFPNGVDYQDLLNALAAENNIEWAQWVLQNFGKLNAVMEVEELTIEGSLFFAGTVIVKGKMKISKWLLAGEGIKAGLGIEAGEGIEAGLGIESDLGIKAGRGVKAVADIKAGEGIKAGEDIKAGLGIEAGEDIEAGWDIEAGADIKAGLGIEAGADIKAGRGIEAGEDIKAGEDFGIYAGLRLKISHKKRHAIIKAKGCPENIICGEFVEV